ncbi:MAG: FkbM family methyltransferase [Cytophagales bacterium]|nr:FkbM family methyltransferase [Cytophagales bacterium]
MNPLKSILLAGMRRRLPGFGFATAKLFPSGIIATNKYGVTMQLNPYEAVEGSVLMDGYFDEPVLNGILMHLQPDDVVWDVGANVGLHSLAIKKLKPTAHVYAFEPFSRNFERLCINQQLNPDLPIHKFNLALGTRVSIAKLYTTPRNAGRTSLQPLQHTQTTEVAVATIAGDDLVLHQVPQPQVIKLDTEGTELEILKGCASILKDTALRVVIYESFTQQQEIKTLLSSHGFTIKAIDTVSNFIAIR